MFNRYTHSRFRMPASMSILVAALVLSGSLLCTTVQADHAGDAADQADSDRIMLEVSSEMTRIAQAILATVAGGPGGIETAVGYNRQQLLALDFTDAARTNYVYWPYLRKGLPLDFMSAQQKTLTHDLIHSALSAKGYLSAIQIMQLEKILADTEVVGFPRGTENYTLSIFGEPGNERQWGWRFEGHHLSLNFTVAPGEVSVTPSFMGASPAELQNGTLAGFRNLREVHDLGLAFVNSLTEAQRALAIQSGNPPFDIVSGTLNRLPATWDDWKALPPTGVPIADLDLTQKTGAQRIIDEVVTTYRPEISRAYLAQIDINDLRFVWYGDTEDGKPHYYRLEGPDFFFEYDLVQNNGNHVHSVWRSKEGDFGADMLLQHRMQQH
ncbi:MAG: DUF3500 domain-containing protein [Pseudomonadales bacterium]|nr:DUF3500 domain-containing protein [Pseudomonadales bacterium]